MKSLCKIVTIMVFLSFSYLSSAENNNITTDTNKKPTNKCFIRFDAPSKCAPINSIIYGLPDNE
jgi:hypothetical protein